MIGPAPPPFATQEWKRWAYGVEANAVRLGLVQPADACEECGGTKYIQGHHRDYSRPLELTWLCRWCHIKEHRYLSAYLIKEVWGKQGQLITAQEAANIIGVGRTTIYSYMRTGLLPTSLFENKRMILMSDAVGFNRPRRPAAPKPVRQTPKRIQREVPWCATCRTNLSYFTRNNIPHSCESAITG